MSSIVSPATGASGSGQEAARSPSKSPLQRARFRIVVGLLLVGAVLAIAGRVLRPKKAIPILGHVASFELVDQAKRPFVPASLGDGVWVADFIFTTCQASCPRLTARMGELQSALAREEARRGRPLAVKLVSFSIDPENDTPDVLSAYAERAKADPNRWTFVTGPTEEMQRIAQEGFKISAVKVERGAADYDIIHGNWFVVGDGQGNIRGYYSTETDADMATLVEDVLRLEAEAKARP